MDTKVAAASLGRVLADSYVLMLKTQNVHWHVVGGAFVGIHTLTEEQYSELFIAVDEIAERIRALGEVAPGTMADYLKLARLKEGLGGSDDISMVQGLVDAHSTMSDLLRKEISSVGGMDDFGSEDLLVGRLRVHEKSAWMLKSILTQIAATTAKVVPVVETVAETPKAAPTKAEKPAKKEKKKEKKAKASPAPVAKVVKPAPAKPAPKKEEPVAPSNNGGGRRRLFGVKADG